MEEIYTSCMVNPPVPPLASSLTPRPPKLCKTAAEEDPAVRSTREGEKEKRVVSA